MKTLISLCKQLQLSFTAESIATACEQAQRQQPSYIEFLTELLSREHEARLEKRAKQRIKEAKFPLVKTLESFDFTKTPDLPEAKIRSLAQGDYIDKAEPIIFIGEPGTGKTHLATALGYCAALQGRCVKFITASRLTNLLIEAKDQRWLSLLTQRFQRYQVLILDELGYLPLAKTDAELLFQILSQRHEKYPIIITTNLPFSEWTSIFTDSRLCMALIDRITHRAHIIETGGSSIRFKQTLDNLNKLKIKQEECIS
jgi:DNA replication protein DnaC